MMDSVQDLPGDFAGHMAAIARGDKPWPNAEGDRHHFTPEFVLRRFRGRTSQGKKLFVLDKTDGSIVESTPQDAGWQHRLYAVDSIDGRHDGLIEAIFGLAENYAYASLKRLLTDDLTRFTDGDRGNLAYLIAAQEQRVPGALEALRLNMVIGGSTFAAVELANVQGACPKEARGAGGLPSVRRRRDESSADP